MPLSKTKMFPVCQPQEIMVQHPARKRFWSRQVRLFRFLCCGAERRSKGPLISFLFRGHLLRRLENPGFAILIKAKHNLASSDHYSVGARFLGFDLSH